jgi:hypothetical protein
MLTPQLLDDIREVAELTSDPELLAIAGLSQVPVRLGHLRGLDPQARIVLRQGSLARQTRAHGSAGPGR